MDSRGCHDALTSTEVPGMSMENSRLSIDVLAISQGLEDYPNQHPAWVPSDMNLSDTLTKYNAGSWKTFMMFRRKSWVLKVHDTFISDRKQQEWEDKRWKKKLEQIWLKNGSKIHPLDILVRISNVELRKGIVLVSRRCIMSVHVGQTFCDWPFYVRI